MTVFSDGILQKQTTFIRSPISRKSTVSKKSLQRHRWCYQTIIVSDDEYYVKDDDNDLGQQKITLVPLRHSIRGHVQKTYTGLRTLLQSVTFLSSDLFLLLFGKVRYFFKIKRWYKIVAVKIINLLLFLTEDIELSTHTNEMIKK